MTLTATRTGEVAPESAFTDQQYDAVYPASYEKHYWHRARLRILRRAIQRVGLSKGTVVEIGCGRGYYVKALRDWGFDAYGCEIAKPTVHPEAKPWVLTGTDFRDLDVSLRQRAKAVLLLDVVEHIADADRFMADILTSFPSLEYVVLTVPARAEIWSNYDEFNGHFRRYSDKDLCQSLIRWKCDVVQLFYFFHALYFAARVLIWMNKPRRVVIAEPKPQWLHRLLGAAFVMETSIVSPRFPGSSLLAIGRVRR